METIDTVVQKLPFGIKRNQEVHLSVPGSHSLVSGCLAREDAPPSDVPTAMLHSRAPYSPLTPLGRLGASFRLGTGFHFPPHALHLLSVLLYSKLALMLQSPRSNVVETLSAFLRTEGRTPLTTYNIIRTVNKEMVFYGKGFLRQQIKLNLVLIRYRDYREHSRVGEETQSHDCLHERYFCAKESGAALEPLRTELAMRVRQNVSSTVWPMVIQLAFVCCRKLFTRLYCTAVAKSYPPSPGSPNIRPLLQQTLSRD